MTVNLCYISVVYKDAETVCDTSEH